MNVEKWKENLVFRSRLVAPILPGGLNAVRDRNCIEIQALSGFNQKSVIPLFFSISPHKLHFIFIACARI